MASCCGGGRNALCFVLKGDHTSTWHEWSHRVVSNQVQEKELFHLGHYGCHKNSPRC